MYYYYLFCSKRGEEKEDSAYLVLDTETCLIDSVHIFKVGELMCDVQLHAWWRREKQSSQCLQIARTDPTLTQSGNRMKVAMSRQTKGNLVGKSLVTGWEATKSCNSLSMCSTQSARGCHVRWSTHLSLLESLACTNLDAYASTKHEYIVSGSSGEFQPVLALSLRAKRKSSYLIP